MEKHRLKPWFISPPILLALFFALVYALIAFVNHYCFRTFALDLGAYTNALYDYSHFRRNDAALFKEVPRNMLSDHFDLFLVIISPLSWIFGQYTLQLVQIIAVLTGGLGVYRYMLFRSNDTRFALLAQLHLYLFFGVFSALSFDYHSNVVAAMLVPFLFLFLEKHQFAKGWAVLAFILICKESMAVMMVSLFLGMLLLYRKDRTVRKQAGWLLLFSVIYFVVVIKMVMPALAPEGKYLHYKYHALGNNYAEALMFIITHPVKAFVLQFVNHLDNPLYDGIKAEFYVFVILSGLPLLLARPAFLLMLVIPVVAKMSYDDPATWSIDSQYSIEFAVILSIGAFSVLQQVGRGKTRMAWAWVLCGLSLAATIRLMDHTVYLHDYNRLRIYQKGHYVRGHDIRAIHHAINSIPADVPVAAQSPLVPHLAYRDKCYQLPIVKDAQYIIASRREPETYPMQRDELFRLLRDSAASGRWEVLEDTEDVTVLRKGLGTRD